MQFIWENKISVTILGMSDEIDKKWLYFLEKSINLFFCHNIVICNMGNFG